MCEHDGRALRAATVVGLMVAALLAGGAAQASAATYHAYLCRIPYGPNAGSPAPTQGVTTAIDGPPATAGDTCAGGGSMFAEVDAPIAVGIGGAVFYSPGANLRIAAFRLWRAMHADGFGGPATYDFVANFFYDQVATIYGICDASAGCGFGSLQDPLAAANLVESPAGFPGSANVGWQAYCGGGGQCPQTPQPTPGQAFTRVFAADITLDDSGAPTVGALSGPLVSGNPVSGTQTVSFPASDAGGGVFRGRLLVDDKVVVDQVLDANGGSCANLGLSPDQRPSFVLTRPCPPTLTGTLALDTTAVAAGAHTLQVAVTDPAGNTTASATRAIAITRDVLAPIPDSGPNGEGASRNAKLTARLAGSHKGVRTLGFKTAPVLSGRLVDEHGAAISGAVIDVGARERRAGAHTATIARPTTGGDGRFRATLASGPSRTITVSYTAFGGDPKPAASVRMRTRVRASVTASVSPRAPRARKRVRVSGRLRYLPRAGVLVAIQARQGSTWRTVDTVETRAKGRYSWPYRFSAANAGRRFALRARVKSPNYPFDPGVSKTVAVRVRP
jgi:hypothetical protein